jgi:putative endonuclease
VNDQISKPDPRTHGPCSQPGQDAISSRRSILAKTGHTLDSASVGDPNLPLGGKLPRHSPPIGAEAGQIERVKSRARNFLFSEAGHPQSKPRTTVMQKSSDGIDGFHYVYILQSEGDCIRHYTGITQDVAARLKAHNSGQVAATARFRSWRVETSVAFSTRDKAEAFERYLKSHSGAYSPQGTSSIRRPFARIPGAR